MANQESVCDQGHWQQEDRHMLNTILVAIMRNALLVLSLGALVLLNTAMWR
jgi:hypothetical protein